MIDTKPELGTCGQCGAYVLGAHVGGVRVCADMQPLSLDAYRQALLAGRTVYVLHPGPGGAPGKLDFDAGWVGPQTPRVAAHGCNAVPRPVQAPPAPPGGVCASWQAQGWIPPATCPRRGGHGDTGPQSCQHCEPPPF